MNKCGIKKKLIDKFTCCIGIVFFGLWILLGSFFYVKAIIEAIIKLFNK